jgi:beta-galactosidase
MDYLGETGTGFVAYADTPGPGAFYEPQPFPRITANCADIDIIGEQRPQSLARDVVWGISPLEMLVQNPAPDGKFERVSKWGWSDELPCWTWPGKEGKPLLVRVYVQADRVELKLNGKVVATKTMPGDAVAPVEFSLPYAPGTLEATAWLGQKQVGQRSLAMTGPTSAIRLIPEKPARGAERNGLLFVRMEITDADGNFVADATNALRLTVNGPARLIGFGSGNPKATGSFQSADAQAFRGRCLAVLKITGQRGPVTLQAEGAGLRRSVATVDLA